MIKIGNSQAVLMLIYGEGGHQTEMSLLLKQLAAAHNDNKPLQLVTLGPQPLDLPSTCQLQQHFMIKDVRDKHSRIRTMFAFIPSNIILLYRTFTAFGKHDLTGVISTGPGVAILPMLVLRLLGVKTVFIETYCRFDTRSLTGRIMSKIAHRFLVQNKSQLALYAKAEYCGRL